MARVLLKEMYLPIKGIQGVVKLSSMQEEFRSVVGNHDGKFIKHLQVGSQITNNVIYVSMGGKVYQYDLVSKECLFSYSTYAYKHMILFDYDDKILVADVK